MKKRLYLSLVISIVVGFLFGVLFHENDTDVFVTDRLLEPSIVECSNSEGYQNASVTLVEFADMDCPYSRTNNKTIDSLIKRFPGQLRYCFRHFPLSIHENASVKAKATIAADAFGKADEMRRILYTVNLAGDIDQTISNIARGTGLDSSAFYEQFHSEKTQEILRNDIRTALVCGVRSTPTVFINGYLLKGAKDVAFYARIIDKLSVSHP